MGHFTYSSFQRNRRRYWYGSSKVTEVAAVRCIKSLHISKMVLVEAGSWRGAPWGQSLTYFKNNSGGYDLGAGLEKGAGSCSAPPRWAVSLDMQSS